MALVREIPERQLVRLGFGHVVEQGSGSVRIDVDIVVRRVESGLFQSYPYAFRLGGAVRTRCGGVVRVAGASVADDFGVDVRSPGEGVFIVFQNHDGRTVRHHESAAVAVEGQGGVFGVLRPGQRLGVGETRDSYRNRAVVASSGDDCIGETVPDGPVGFTYRVGGGGARGHDVDARALGVELDGNLPSGHVADHRGHEVGRNPLARRVLGELLDLALYGLETAYARTYVGGQAGRFNVLAGHEPRILHGLPGRGHGVDGEGVLLADERLVHAVLLRIEVAHHAAYLDGEVLGGVFGDMVDSADSVDKIVPECGYVIAYAGENSKACYCDSSFHKY